MLKKCQASVGLNNTYSGLLCESTLEFLDREAKTTNYVKEEKMKEVYNMGDCL